MTDDTIHTCSYSCERPGCIRAQRDELVAKVEALRTEAEQHLRQAMSNGAKARAAQAQADNLRTEIEALRAENEAMKRCAIKYLGWLGVTHMPLDQALHDDMCNPSMCGDAALLKENSND